MQAIRLKTFIIFIFSSLALPLYASQRLHNESQYQSKWCSEVLGVKEYRLNDKTRVDCLTKTHAIEFDFANKVSITFNTTIFCRFYNTSYYSIKTCRKPGIVLIVEKPEKEQKYIERMQQVADKNGIDCWIMYESDLYDFQMRPVK